MSSPPTRYEASSAPNRRQFLRHTAVGAAAAAALPAILAACGGSPQATGSVGTSPTTKPDVKLAQQEGTVSLYSTLDPSIIANLNRPFTKKYGIQVQVYRPDTGTEVLDRILTEASTGHILADVVDDSSWADFLVLQQKHLLRPYVSPEAKTVPANLIGPGHHWVADRLTQQVIAWNTKAILSSKAPKHWTELSKHVYKGQEAYIAATDGSSAPPLWTMAQAFGWKLLEGWAANQPLRVESTQIEGQAVVANQRPIGIAMNDNIAFSLKKQGQPIDYVYPSEGVPTTAGCLGVLANSPHPNAALLYYDYWMSKPAQEISAASGKYSSRLDVNPPSGAPSLKKLKLLPIDWAGFTKNQKSIEERMQKIFGGDWGITS